MPNNLEKLQQKINYISLRTDSNLDETVCEALQSIHDELEILRTRTAPVGTTPIDSSLSTELIEHSLALNTPPHAKSTPFNPDLREGYVRDSEELDDGA